jgi:hypothetical protein
MRRSAFDKLMSTAGLILAVLLVVAGGLLFWASRFVDDNVATQLSQQNITMPEGEAISSLPDEDRQALEPFAGEPLTNGAQAQAYADHYIKAHLQGISGGRTYSEVSGEFQQMDPSDPDYEQVAGQRQALFMGETLRGLLLNAYAFWKMGQIALWASIAAFAGAAIFLVLALLGFRHARVVPPDARVGDDAPARESARV